MNQEELTKLREQILSDIIPLTLDTVDAGADRFSLLLRLIQSGGTDGEIYRKAYESAKAIDDKEEQLSALMALLDEVDFDLQREGDSQSQDSQRDTSRPNPEVSASNPGEAGQYE